MGRNREAKIGAVIVAVFLLTAIVVGIATALGITVTPYGPVQTDTGPKLAPPSLSHLFGTDLLGRDVFSRIIVATPNDVSVGVGVVAFALVVGLIIGSIAALKGGLLDELLMRFTDVVFALPALVIAMVIAVALGPGVTNMMIALMIIWWPPHARLARGEALKVSHQNYIRSARSEEHTSELQSQSNLVCRLLLEKKKRNIRRGRSEQLHAAEDGGTSPDGYGGDG